MRIEGASNLNDAELIKYYSSPVTKDEGALRNEGVSNSEIQKLKRAGKIECQTCKERKYVDGSNDPGVSFKTPTKINPAASGAKVLGHEMEHYTRESAKAAMNDREVVSNSIRLTGSVCPECGKSYISGGETTTVTRDKKETEHFYNKDYQEKIAPYFPDKFEVFA